MRRMSGSSPLNYNRLSIVEPQADGIGVVVVVGVGVVAFPFIIS